MVPLSSWKNSWKNRGKGDGGGEREKKKDDTKSGGAQIKAEKILQRMIKKNPVLQKLIDELDLVLVDASHIASDDKSPP